MSKIKGFTLVEVMIVVAVLAILASVAYPSYQSYVKQKNRKQILDELPKECQIFKGHKVPNFISESKIPYIS